MKDTGALRHAGKSMLTERSCRCELSDLQGCVAEPVNTDLKAAGGQGLEGGQWLLAKGETQQLTGERAQLESTALSLEGFLQTKTNTLPRSLRNPLGAMMYLSTHAGDDQLASLCLQ